MAHQQEFVRLSFVRMKFARKRYMMRLAYMYQGAAITFQKWAKGYLVSK